MGKRGPMPTPTKVLKNRGSRRVKHRVGEAEPPPGEIICPPWVTGEARVVWERLSQPLREMGVLTCIDTFAFARYCVYTVLWLRELSNPGRTEATLERYANQLSRLENCFGLTPSARAAMAMERPEKEDDEFDLLIKKRQTG